MNAPTIYVTETADLAVDTREIEAGLTRLWRQAADTATGRLVRASSLTILVLLVERGIETRVGTVLAQVAVAHPCRVLLLKLVDGEPSAHLAAHHRPALSGQPATQWEEVRLESNAAGINRLLSAAQSLVLPNLPVHVWWPGEADLGSDLFQRAVELGDRVIVDSSEFRQTLASLARYAEHAETEHGSVGFADLAWRRLEPWRLLTAQFFDAPPDRLFLSHIDSVLVGYTRPPSASRNGFAEALLLAGWLASRLGWTPTPKSAVPDEGIQQLTFDDGGRAVRVELRASASKSVAHELASVQLCATHEGQSAQYSIEAEQERVTMVGQVDGARRVERMYLPKMSEADLLQREFGEIGRDRIYEEALQVVRWLTPRPIHSVQ